MIYLQLFLSFLQVGMFSVGGGYAAMPLIQSQVVEQHGWLTMQEFTDLITIAEMTPGPIAVNSATFVGLRIAQVPGAIIATLGCITPALFFVSLLILGAAYFDTWQWFKPIRKTERCNHRTIHCQKKTFRKKCIVKVKFWVGQELAPISFWSICSRQEIFISINRSVSYRLPPSTLRKPLMRLLSCVS